MGKGFWFFFGGMFAVVLVLGFPAPGRADIYRYVDASGVVHFTDAPTNNRYSLYLKEGDGQGSIRQIIHHYARIYHLEEALVRAVIKAESDFDSRAVSTKGAVGIMQVMPETGREMAVNDLRNTAENIRAGSHYLRKMLNLFHGDLSLALAAYNAGPAAVQRFGGIPPFAETRTYVKRVEKYLQLYRQREDSSL